MNVNGVGVLNGVKQGLLINLFLVSVVVGSSIAYSKFYFFHAVVAILFLIFLHKFDYRDLLLPQNFTIRISLLFFVLTIFWYLMTFFWTWNVVYSLRYIFYLVVCGTIPFFLIHYVNSAERFLGAYQTLKYCFCVEILIALLEITFGYHLPTSPYSGYSHFFGRQGTRFDEFSAEVILLIKHVPTGFHHNPNNLALVFGCLVPFFLFLKSKLNKVFGTSCMLVLILACGSRGVFLGTAIGIISYFAIYGSKAVLLLFAVGILIFISCINQFHFLELSGFEQVNGAFAALGYYLDWNHTGSGSIADRHELIRNGLVALRDSYGLGVGGGSSLAIQEIAGGVVGDLGSIHNFWIEVLVEAGVCYFVLFILWYCFLALRLLGLSKTSSSSTVRYHSGALFVALIIFGVGCISASSVIYHLPMWLMFGWALLIVKLSRRIELCCF